MRLDNHGGYSHAGRRVVLRVDGSYIDTRYTDAVGHELTKAGTYSLNSEKTQLVLSPYGGEAEHLHRVDYNGRRYWVHAQNRTRVTESDEDWLRQISLRVDER